MNRVLIAVLAIGAVLVLAGAVAAAGNGSTPPGYAISSGTEVSGSVFSTQDQQLLGQLRATGGITRVGTLGGVAFFVVDTADGGRCYGFGRAPSGGLNLGCSTDPELQQPISDMSIVALDPTDPEHGFELREFQGIAADGIASVGVVDRNGTVYSTPVVSNVYRMPPSDVPRIQPSALVAFDATGRRVYRESSTSFDVVGNEGRAVDSSQISASDQDALVATGATGPAFFMGSRGGTAFYRLAGRSGRSCYALGADSEPRALGSIACPDAWVPTRATPILDQSALSVDPGTRTIRVTALRGIAANGVARVGVLDAAGRLYTAVVSENLYYLRSTPAGADRAIVAFDSRGTEIFEMPLTFQR